MQNELEHIKRIYFAQNEFEPNVAFDHFGRYIPTANDYWIHQPVVSEFLHSNGFKPVYPGGKKWVFCLSHDVDRLFEKKWKFKTLVHQQTKALLKFNFSDFKNNFRYIKRKVDPRNDLNRWINYEKEKGIHSTYFFLSLKEGEEDFNYLPEEIKSIFSGLKKEKHEIALHGGHLAFNNSEKMISEKNMLEDASLTSVSGYRNHYLRFDIKTSWFEMMKAGFKYDSTFGHASVTGYRNGMAHPFQFSDRNGDQFPFYVLPLHVMDGTLENYLKLDAEQSLQLVIKHIEQIKDVNGVFTLLWHNNKSDSKQLDLFHSIINYAGKFDPWFATSHDIIEYYKENKYFDQINEILKIGK